MFRFLDSLFLLNHSLFVIFCTQFLFLRKLMFKCYCYVNLNLQSRPIFNKSTRFEDMKNAEDERIPYRRPTVKKYTYFPSPSQPSDFIGHWHICRFDLFFSVIVFYRPVNNSGRIESRDGDLDLDEFSR